MSKKLSKEEMRMYQRERRKRRCEELEKEGFEATASRIQSTLLNDGEPQEGKLARNWTLIVYPDSAPPNWKVLLDGLYTGWCCSPLHDKDINDDGTEKKPHYHVVLSFDGKKSYKQIMAVNRMLSGTGKVEVVGSMRRMIRYLAHLDNPEKHQYPAEEIENHGLDNFRKYIMASDEQKEAVLREISEFIHEYGISEYSTIYYYAMYNNDLWYYTLISASGVVDKLIRSLRHSRLKPYNPVTGEIYNPGNTYYIEVYEKRYIDWAFESIVMLVNHWNKPIINYERAKDY